MITQIDKVDEDWWSGSCGANSGLFPATYVELVESGGGGGVQAAAVEEDQADHSVAAGIEAIALYDYAADEENELSLREGDLVSRIDVVDEDWWFGASGGRTGLFPAAYVERK